MTTMATALVISHLLPVLAALILLWVSGVLWERGIRLGSVIMAAGALLILAGKALAFLAFLEPHIH